MILVRLGRGELGRDGGSCAGAGVLVPSDIVWKQKCEDDNEVLVAREWGTRTRTRLQARRVAIPRRVQRAACSVRG
jgi:hypothetical protein